MNEENKKRRSKNEIRLLARKLDTREMKILEHLHKVKFATSDQLRRVFFTENKNDTAGLRACNRATKRMKEVGVIDHLDQQVGGKRGGSSGKIWTFSGTGYNLLKLENTKLKVGRKRLYEPTSILFLEHMLAINEIYTKLLELNQQKKIELLEAQHEPRCWRTFSERGISFYVKPDLFASLVPAREREFETVYFLEIDRATEAPSKVIKKCKQYITYYNSGIEQRQNGVFPFVVWITPNRKRCEQLIRYIHENLPKAEMLFRVITAEEFNLLICETKNQKEDK